MIEIFPDDLEKISIIDKFIRVISSEDLTSIVENDLMVGKLKGTSENVRGPISEMFANIDRQNTELTILRVENISLKDDYKQLLKILDQYFFRSGTYSPDFNTLKTKHNIY